MYFEVVKFGKSRNDPDGVEWIAASELVCALVVSLSLGPGVLYLFYSQDSLLINHLVWLVQALSFFIIPEYLALVAVLIAAYITGFVALSFIIPTVIFMIVFINSCSCWILGFTKSWLVQYYYKLKFTNIFGTFLGTVPR